MKRCPGGMPTAGDNVTCYATTPAHVYFRVCLKNIAHCALVFLEVWELVLLISSLLLTHKLRELASDISARPAPCEWPKTRCVSQLHLWSGWTPRGPLTSEPWLLTFKVPRRRGSVWNGRVHKMHETFVVKEQPKQERAVPSGHWAGCFPRFPMLSMAGEWGRGQSPAWPGRCSGRVPCWVGFSAIEKGDRLISLVFVVFFFQRWKLQDCLLFWSWLLQTEWLL